MGGELNLKNFNELEEKFSGEKIEEIFGTENLTWPKYISGSRMMMFNTHICQSVVLNNPEYPQLSTGKENAYGDFSDGIVKSKRNCRILEKISRYKNNPNFKYILLVEDTDTGEYDVIEVCHYEKLTNIYGYVKPEIRMDEKNIGDIIRKDEIISKSNSFDEFGNYKMGVNAKTAFLSIAETQEDAVLISDEFAEKTRFDLIKEINIPINSNDILLNIFGDDNVYKCLPEIGDEIDEKGIICAVRKLVNSQAMFSLTWESLRSYQQSDELFEGKGRILDIDIVINKLEEFEDVNEPSHYRYQLKELYDEQFEYYNKVYKALYRLVSGRNRFTVSDKLKHVFRQAANYINNADPNSPYEIKVRTASGTLFEFAYLSIKLVYNTGLLDGFKLVNRYASKGILSKIVPKEFMPRDIFGNQADVVINATASVSRANPGQNIELELNFINESIVRKMKELETLDDKYNLLLSFLSDVNKDQADHIYKSFKSSSKKSKLDFINSIEEMGYMLIQQNSFYNTIDWKKINELYDKYEIKRSYIRWKVPYTVQNKSDRYKTKREWDLIKQQKKIFWSDKDKVYNGGFKMPINPVSAILAYNKAKKENENIENRDIIIWKNDPVTLEKFLDKKKKSEEEIAKMEKSLRIYENRYEDMEIAKFNSEETYIYEGKNKNSIIRDYRSSAPVIIANMYYLILKQIPESGFSATSIGTVSQLDLPIKPNKKETSTPYVKTPVAKGYMEISNAIRRLNPLEVHRFIATHSSNPEAKDLLVKMLLMEDPLEAHDIPMESDKILNDVPAQMLWAYLFSTGVTICNDGEEDIFERFDDFPMNINEYFNKKNNKKDI